MTDLIPLKNPNLSELFAKNGLDAIIAGVEKEARSIVPSIDTAKGRKEIASIAAKVARSKTYLDGIGKEYVADLKEKTRAVDAVRKDMRVRLDALKVEVREPLTKWEQAEEARIAAIQERIVAIKSYAQIGYSEPSENIEAAISDLENIDVDESFGEFKDDAHTAKNSTLYQLGKALDEARQAEEFAAKQEEERKAREEAERKAREERIALEAADRARREAEEKARLEAEEKELVLRQQREQEARELTEAKRREEEAIAALERAEREAKLAAEEEKRRVKEEQEQKRIEQEKRESDKRHCSGVNIKARDAIATFGEVTQTEAQRIVVAIIKGKIPNITITY